jgi:hypothetical protein
VENGNDGMLEGWNNGSNGTEENTLQFFVSPIFHYSNIPLSLLSPEF